MISEASFSSAASDVIYRLCFFDVDVQETGSPPTLNEIREVLAGHLDLKSDDIDVYIENLAQGTLVILRCSEGDVDNSLTFKAIISSVQSLREATEEVLYQIWADA